MTRGMMFMRHGLWALLVLLAVGAGAWRARQISDRALIELRQAQEAAEGWRALALRLGARDPGIRGNIPGIDLRDDGAIVVTETDSYGVVYPYVFVPKEGEPARSYSGFGVQVTDEQKLAEDLGLSKPPWLWDPWAHWPKGWKPQGYVWF